MLTKSRFHKRPTGRCQETTANVMIRKWNEGLQEARDAVEKYNNELIQMHKEKKITARDVAKRRLKYPTKVDEVSERWGRTFMKRFGWSLLSSSQEQASLPYDHADMEMYRQHYKHMLSQGVHKHLVLNFDQVWRCAFSWNGKMHWKPRTKVGKTGKKTKTPKQLDKKRHAVRGARKSLTVPRCKLKVEKCLFCLDTYTHIQYTYIRHNMFIYTYFPMN